MPRNYRDHSDEYRQLLEQRVYRAVEYCAASVMKYAKQITGRAISPPPSKWYHPPHMVTRQLNRDIRYEMDRQGDEIIGRIGTNVKHGRWLELGTSRMKKRPFLRPSLEAKKQLVIQQLKGVGVGFEE